MYAGLDGLRFSHWQAEPREDGVLVLQLAESHAALFGGPTEKDMKLLAGRLGIGWRVDIVAESAL